MIDIQLIESAKLIRKEFLKINRNLNHYQEDVKNLYQFYLKKVEDLSVLRDNITSTIKNKSDIQKVTQQILTEIESIEIEEKKLTEKVKKLNLQLEKLSQDEKVLYKTIQSRYPELTEDEIVKEIKSHLEK